MTTFYCPRFETTPIWRARSPYLHPPGTGWPSYTPRHWVPFSSPPTTRRATVEVFDPASTRSWAGYLLPSKIFIYANSHKEGVWTESVLSPWNTLVIMTVHESSSVIDFVMINMLLCTGSIWTRQLIYHEISGWFWLKIFKTTKGICRVLS
jgi:hypothetical protein